MQAVARTKGHLLAVRISPYYYVAKSSQDAVIIFSVGQTFLSAVSPVLRLPFVTVFAGQL